MGNRDKTAEERNRDKEISEKRAYEICLNEEEMEACDDEDIVVEICNILIAKKISYREANRVLYNADKALRIRALDKKLL